jgi:hypothetical protein
MTSVRIDSKTIHSLILPGRSGQLLLREGGEDSPNLRIVSFKHRFDTERKRRREREKEEKRERERDKERNREREREGEIEKEREREERDKRETEKGRENGAVFNIVLYTCVKKLRMK